MFGTPPPYIALMMKYCGTEVDAYGQCLTDHPKDWQTACAELKEKACNCLDHDPVGQIHRDCASEFGDYHRCCKTNSEDVTVCLDRLYKFLKCADTSAHRIQNAILEKTKQDGTSS